MVPATDWIEHWLEEWCPEIRLGVKRLGAARAIREYMVSAHIRTLAEAHVIMSLFRHGMSHGIDACRFVDASSHQPINER